MTLSIQQYLPLNPMQVIKRYVFKNRFVTWLPGELPGMAKVSSKQVGILHRYVVLSLDLLPQSTWVVIALYLLQPVSKKALYCITELNDYQVIKKIPIQQPVQGKHYGGLLEQALHICGLGAQNTLQLYIHRHTCQFLLFVGLLNNLVGQ